MASGKPRGNSRRKSAGRKKSELLALASGATVLASWYAHAVAADPDKTPYDLSFWREGASIAGTALSTWLVHRRSPAAFPAAAATAFGTIALGAANVLKKGAYVTRTWKESSIKEKAFNRAMPLVHAAGAIGLEAAGALVAWGRRSDKSVLAGPLSTAPWYPQARKLGLYFMTFSMLGHWVEMLFCTGIKHGIFKGGYDRENHMLWDQWLFPFPAEGTAAVLANVALTPAKSAIERAVATSIVPKPLRFSAALATSFLVNQLACTSVDFATGMVANRNYELWDYRDMRFHFMGQVCLQNSLFYSIIATWGVWQLLPALEKLMEKAGDTKLDGILVGMGSVFLFLELLYQAVPPKKKDAGNEEPDTTSDADKAE